VTILDTLLRATVTGKPLRLPGTRRPIISIEGVHAVIRHGLWPQALHQIITLDAVHIDAQVAFARVWKRMQFRTAMNGVDDDLYYAGLRKMLPAYQGGGMTLYRGQDPGDPVGSSWSEDRQVALRFALYGLEIPDDETEPMIGGMVLTANVPASAIICSVHDYIRPGSEREVVIDPRGIAYTAEPAKPEHLSWPARAAISNDLIDAVRAMHNSLFASSDSYRNFISATPERNTEGSVDADEFFALQILREAATGNVTAQKLATLSEALHAVLLADGLDGSLEAAQQHVAAVQKDRRLLKAAFAVADLSELEGEAL